MRIKHKTILIKLRHCSKLFSVILINSLLMTNFYGHDIYAIPGPVFKSPGYRIADMLRRRNKLDGSSPLHPVVGAGFIMNEFKSVSTVLQHPSSIVKITSPQWYRYLKIFFYK